MLAVFSSLCMCHSLKGVSLPHQVNKLNRWRVESDMVTNAMVTTVITTADHIEKCGITAVKGSSHTVISREWGN